MTDWNARGFGSGWPVVASVRVSDEVREQLIALGCRNARRALGPLFVAITLAYLLLTLNEAPAVGPTLWAAVTALVIVTRFVLLCRLRAATRFSPTTKCRLVAAMNFCLGSAFGAVLLFFPEADLFERAMLTVLLLGIASGVIGSNLGHPPLFLSFTLPMLGTLAVLWIANPNDAADTALALTIGVAIVLMTITHARMAREVFDVFVLSITSSNALGTQTARLEEQTERLSLALAEAERAKRLAESGNASKSRFIAAASHDLRQPVHVLNLYGAALAKADLDPKVRTIVADMGLAVASLSAQLESLLDLSKLDAGTVEPELGPVDLAAVTRALANEFGALAAERGIDFVDALERPVHVLSDRTMLMRLLRNLCGNAIDFTPSGSVTLSARTRGESVTLSIEDTGIGIADADRERVFEEFYQVANTGRDRHRGTGLGLAIVARLARLLEHELELRSALGGGTTVRVAMRRVEAPTATGPEMPPGVAAERRAVLPAGCWVHVVDDDPAVRRSMRAMLEGLGVEVSASESTATTLERLARERRAGRVPSAVLIDLRLGDGDSGVRTVDALRRSHPDVPLAIVTGESAGETEILTRYPELLVLYKPVPEEDMIELLEFMIAERAGAARREASARIS